MGRNKNWVTISVPQALYDEVLEFHVKAGRATSVQEYFRFWARIGSLTDRALAASPDAAALAKLLSALLDERRKTGDE